jgi:nitrate reductase NapE component
MSQRNLDKRRLWIVINCFVAIVVIIFIILSIYHEIQIFEHERVDKIAKETYDRGIERCSQTYSLPSTCDPNSVKDDYMIFVCRERKLDLFDCERRALDERSYSQRWCNIPYYEHRNLVRMFLWLAFLFPVMFYAVVFGYKQLHKYLYPTTSS